MPRHELTKAHQLRVIPLMQRALDGRTQAELARLIGLESHTQVSRAAKLGTLSRMSALLLCRLLDEDPAIVGLGDLGCPLAATPGWGEASADLDPGTRATLGRTIPPVRLSKVTSTAVHMYHAAWLATSRYRGEPGAAEPEAVADLPPLARPTTFASPAVGEARSVGAEEEGKSRKGRRKK